MLLSEALFADVPFGAFARSWRTNKPFSLLARIAHRLPRART